ncbi:MAG: hypothetical protein JXB04_01580, partial [Kiritimatiellae bacterium]|nr:hypothetical protein [Kiritimatiellia bacterium]
MVGKSGAGFSNGWKLVAALLLLASVAQAGIVTGPFGGWAALTNLPEARSYPAAALVGSELYAIGGRDSGGATRDTVWMLDVDDPSAGWTAVSNLPSGRDNMAAAALGTRIYVIAGSDGTNNQSDVYVYDTT